MHLGKKGRRKVGGLEGNTHTSGYIHYNPPPPPFPFRPLWHSMQAAPPLPPFLPPYPPPFRSFVRLPSSFFRRLLQWHGGGKKRGVAAGGVFCYSSLRKL